MTAFLRRYQYVGLAILLGAILLLWPSRRAETGAEQTSEASAPDAAAQASKSYQVRDLEDRLRDLLSQIDGAGQVDCVLSYATGTRRQYLADTQTDASGGELRRETVLVETADGAQAPVVVLETWPQYQGAVIVCDGGDDPVVRLQITQAVSALTGLGADRITIAKRTTN